MQNEVVKSELDNADVTVDAHIDIKLEGWPASATLITLCLSGVMIYGIYMWGQTRQM